MLNFILTLLAFCFRFSIADGATGCCGGGDNCFDCCASGMPDEMTVTISGTSGACPSSGNCADFLDGDYVVDIANANLGQCALSHCGGSLPADCDWSTSFLPWGTCGFSLRTIGIHLRDCGGGAAGDCQMWVYIDQEASYMKQAAEDHGDICSFPVTLDKVTDSGCGAYQCSWPATVTVSA